MTLKKIDPNAIYTAENIKEVLGISRQLVSRMIKESRLPKAKAGRKYLWTGQQVLEALGQAPTKEFNTSRENIDLSKL